MGAKLQIGAIVALLALPVFAQSPNVIMTSPSDLVPPGSSFTTSVQFVTGSTNASSYQAAIKYDRNVLELKSYHDIFGTDANLLCNDRDDPSQSGTKLGIILCTDDESSQPSGVPPDANGKIVALELTFQVRSGTAATSSEYEVLKAAQRPNNTNFDTPLVYDVNYNEIISAAIAEIKKGVVNIQSHANPPEPTGQTPGGSEVTDDSVSVDSASGCGTESGALPLLGFLLLLLGLYCSNRKTRNSTYRETK